MADPRTPEGRHRETLEQVARDFIDYYTGRERHPGGGCGHCGGLPHSTTCFVGRCEAALSRDAAPVDGSVYVRVDPVYVEQMRGEGMGPFARVRLVEPPDGEPRLELTVQQPPTPDSAEWWREVAQGLGVEIHKLKAALSAQPAAPTEPTR